MELLSEVEFLRHLPDDTLVFKIDDREISMGEGQASKVLVERKGKRKEIPAPVPKRGTYVLAKIDEQLVTIGRGLAEKVWVE